jgi:hypothetical protein
MLTDHDLIADLSRLRERGAGIEYTGEIPLTRRSAAATVVPVAALAAVGALGAVAVVGSGTDGSGARTSAGQGVATPAGGADASPGASATATGDTIELVSATVTLGGKTISYRHAVGEDPFADGWQLAVEYGASLPQGATKFLLPNGDAVWVADAADAGTSVMITSAGPRGDYYGMPSTFGRAALEEFVRTNLQGRSV